MRFSFMLQSKFNNFAEGFMCKSELFMTVRQKSGVIFMLLRGQVMFILLSRANRW